MPINLALALLIAAAQPAAGVGGNFRTDPVPAAAAPAAASAPSEPKTVVKDSKVTREVDCRGGDLIVVGDDDLVAVKGCVGVTVIGDRNRVRAVLLEESFVEVTGRANVVRWTAAPGWSPRVEAKGGVNTLAPL